MRLIVDIDTFKVTTQIGSTDTPALRLKRGDAREITVLFVKDGFTPVLFDIDADLWFSAKLTTDLGGDLLIHSDSFTRPADAADGYTFTPDVNSVELNAAIDGLLRVALYAEIGWDDPVEGRASTSLISLTVDNDVFQGGESTPVPAMPEYPAPGVVVRTDTAQTITGAKTFSDGALKLRNVAGTFSVSFSNTATGNRTVTLPDANTTLPVFSQVVTFSGPTAARTITVPDASFTVARIDAGQTFSGNQDISSIVVTGTANYTSTTATNIVSNGAVNVNSDTVLSLVGTTSLVVGTTSYGFVVNQAAGSITATGFFPTIEIGHANDTTLARSAAGIATLEGRVIESSLVGVKSADQTKTSDAVMANDADMAVTLPAGTYRISVHAIYANANASSQVQGKINFTGTATAATGTLEAGLHTAAGIRGSYPNSTDADLFAPTFSNTGQNQWYIVQGTLVVTVQGILSWRWAQYASSANSITLKKGSIVIATKLT